jgi:hypothetical protein
VARRVCHITIACNYMGLCVALMYARSVLQGWDLALQLVASQTESGVTKSMLDNSILTEVWQHRGAPVAGSHPPTGPEYPEAAA